ncbi:MULTISPECIES: DUF3263 domain-containing protein [Protofrankia]|uniref:DUF3263 domain-containing protein n=1 Tax=Protofrankia TaxID=2994361 RepID=UPI0009F8DCD0|nr:DUF3263 domain-containing protein [Protofrankia coriariae]
MNAAHVLAPESQAFQGPHDPVRTPASSDPPEFDHQTASSDHQPRLAHNADAAGPAAALDERQRRVLEFEHHWWRYAGAKETAIRAEFGISATRYYQILNALIDSPAALAADPMLVRRLRRLRATRRRARSGHTGRPDPAEI